MAYTEDDRKYIKGALSGALDDNYVPSDEQPEPADIAPHEILSFAVPTEGGMGSGSGAEGSAQAEHPLPPLEAPTTPRAEGPPTTPEIPSPTVSVSGSGESNATTQAPPVLNVGTTEIAAPAPPPAGLVSHDPSAAGGGGTGLAPPAHLGLKPLPAKPPPPDYSGVQTWQDRLEQAQREQLAALGAGDTAKADALEQFKREHAQMVQAHNKANEDAHNALLAQQSAQNARWDAFQSREIDPDKFVHDMPGWQKGLALAAMIAGGARAGFEGGSNQALAAFEGAINRSVDAQKAAFERDSRVLQHGDNLYAQNYQMYRDDAAARAATEADHWQMAKWELENLANQTNSAEQKAVLQQQIAQTNQAYELKMAQAGQKTALVNANKQVADAKKQADTLAAQAVAGIHTGAGFAAATGQPAPKTAGAGGASPRMTHEQAQAAWESGKITDAQYRAMFPTPGAKSPAVSAAASEAPKVQARQLDPKEEGQLVDMGDGTFAIPRSGVNKATGEAVGNRVYSIPQKDGSRLLVEADEPVRITAEAQKGKGAGGGPRFTAREEFADMKQAAKDLATIEPGLKFGEEGASARERYSIIQRSEIGRRMGLPELDASSSDAWDRTRAALREVVGSLNRHIAERQRLFDQYGDQPAAAEPEQ